MKRKDADGDRVTCISWSSRQGFNVIVEWEKEMEKKKMRSNQILNAIQSIKRKRKRKRERHEKKETGRDTFIQTRRRWTTERFPLFFLFHKNLLLPMFFFFFPFISFFPVRISFLLPPVFPTVIQKKMNRKQMSTTNNNIYWVNREMGREMRREIEREMGHQERDEDEEKKCSKKYSSWEGRKTRKQHAIQLYQKHQSSVVSCVKIRKKERRDVLIHVLDLISCLSSFLYILFTLMGEDVLFLSGITRQSKRSLGCISSPISVTQDVLSTWESSALPSSKVLSKIVSFLFVARWYHDANEKGNSKIALFNDERGKHPEVFGCQTLSCNLCLQIHFLSCNHRRGKRMILWDIKRIKCENLILVFFLRTYSSVSIISFRLLFVQ